MREVTDAQCNFAGAKRIRACYSKFALVCARTQLHDIPLNFAVMYAGGTARAAASLEAYLQSFLMRLVRVIMNL